MSTAIQTGSVRQYLGRSVDLAAWHGVDPRRVARLEATLVPAGTGGYVVAGPQKVVQRFLLRLLKRQGTMRFLPREGTLFMRDAMQGRWRTVADVAGSFYRAVSDIRLAMAAEESEDDPLDERFLDARLISVELLARDGVRIRVQLQTRDPNRVFLFPINVMV